MPDVRLVTAAVLPVPDPDLGRMRDALTARAVDVDVARWDDTAVDWSDTPVTVLRSPWDYVERLDEFLTWVDHAGRATALWNPPALVRWNTHKAYLLELAGNGAPVVPTILLQQGSAASLAGIADAQGWNAVVVKPAVAVGAGGAGRFEVGDAAGQLHLDALLTDGDVLVQPYAAAVEREGEVSVVLIDGRATHAVRKTPAAGDFRIHEHHGGKFRAIDLADAPVALAERVAATLPTPTLYARVDVILIGGHWHVIEVEATEPRLYLEHAPDSATDALVAAVITRLERRAP
jgi:glutathione synthase/RimK-type ligase-like ATP-grasp enzyme